MYADPFRGRFSEGSEKKVSKKGSKTIVLAALTVIGSYLALKELKEETKMKNYTEIYKNEPTAEHSDSFEWISSEIEENVSESLKSPKNEGQEKEPKFEVGSYVATYSPFTGEFVDVDWDGTPIYFEVLDVEFDKEDGTYRYLLEDEIYGESPEGEGEWIAEEWLKQPKIPIMVKAEEPNHLTVKNNLEEKKDEAERNILFKALEDQAKQTEIDYLLGRLNKAIYEENEEEAAEIKEKLRKLMKK